MNDQGIYDDDPLVSMVYTQIFQRCKGYATRQNITLRCGF